MAHRYLVSSAVDDTGYLADELKQVVKYGGRVVSVLWLPERSGVAGKTLHAQYVIVSEHDDKSGF